MSPSGARLSVLTDAGWTVSGNVARGDQAGAVGGGELSRIGYSTLPLVGGWIGAVERGVKPVARSHSRSRRTCVTHGVFKADDVGRWDACSRPIHQPSEPFALRGDRCPARPFLPSRNGNRCSCRPSFQAQVWSGREGKTLRKTLRDLGWGSGLAAGESGRDPQRPAPLALAGHAAGGS